MDTTKKNNAIANTQAILFVLLVITLIALVMKSCVGNPFAVSNCRSSGYFVTGDDFLDRMIDIIEHRGFDYEDVFLKYYAETHDEFPSIDDPWGYRGWGSQQVEWYDAIHFMNHINDCKKKRSEYQQAGLFPTTLPPKELVNWEAEPPDLGPPDWGTIRLMNEYLKEIAYQVDWYAHRSVQ